MRLIVVTQLGRKLYLDKHEILHLAVVGVQVAANKSHADNPKRVQTFIDRRVAVKGYSHWC
jgi:hypothetical protein